jgi:hypothetical protein
VQIRTNNRTRQSPPVNDKALVRFVDVDVEPGAEYQYRIQLRFSNPNYGQDPSIVSYPGLAKDKVLQLSPAVETPRVKIPANTDHKFYITNIDAYQQKSFVNRINSAKSIDRLFTKELLADKYVPFQVHAFIEKVEEPNKPSRDVADWVVAERLLVARGELIGRDCEVELRIWNKRRAQWDFVGGPAGLAKPGTKISGVVVPFQPKPPVVLLDFVGGKQYYKTPKGADFFEDSATEALVLMPDLTMKLRNARDDAEARSEPTSDYRHTFDQWKTRLEDARNAQKAPDKGGR